MAGSVLTELGRLGQKRYGGTFFEEFLKELQGHRGIEAFREMSENDDVIGAILFAIELLIRQTSDSADLVERTAGRRKRERQGSGGICLRLHGRYAGHMVGHCQRDSFLPDFRMERP